MNILFPAPVKDTIFYIFCIGDSVIRVSEGNLPKC